MNLIDKPEAFVKTLKEESKKQNIKIKDTFSFVRIGLIGSSKGPGIGELIDILGVDESKKRIEVLLQVTKN